MHVPPSDFRAVRRDGVALQYALLGDVGFATASFPPSGSRETFAERLCESPHWGLTAAGDVELELAGERHRLAPGTAFHVPAGQPHRFLIAGEARLAGFEPLRPGVGTPAALAAAGFEPVRRSADVTGIVSLVSPRPERQPGEGEILAESRRMGEWLFTRARFGRRAGYTSTLCDLPHWGLVLAGSLAVETEDGVEVLGAGDVFRCEAGPPGHRLQAAEPAVILDYTPVEAIERPAPHAARVVDWRMAAARAALAEVSPAPRLEVAVLG